MAAHAMWVASLVIGFHGSVGFFNFVPLIFLSLVMLSPPIWLCVGKSSRAGWIVLTLSVIVGMRLVFLSYLLLRFDLTHPATWGRPVETLQLFTIPLAAFWLAEIALAWRAVRATSALRHLTNADAFN